VEQLRKDGEKVIDIDEEAAMAEFFI